MHNDRLQQDTEARRAALDPARSFIVEAPAGSGKTELIAQRFLRLLASVDAPEEIVALTFTKKAASEMRTRILKSLHAATAPLPNTAAAHERTTWELASAALARDRARDWNLHEQPTRLRISTIDSLCASLAQQMPLLSRFGQNPGISDAPEDAYREAAAAVVAQAAAGSPVERMLARMDNDAERLADMLADMLQRRDQWLHQPGQARSEIEAAYALLIADTLQRVSVILGPLEQQILMPPVRFALPELANWTTPLTANPADLLRWQALAGLLLTQEGTLRKQFTKNHGFPAEERAIKAQMLQAVAQLPPGAEAALVTVRGLPEAQLQDAEADAITDAAELLRLAMGELWLAFRRRGEVDFIEIAHRARRALGDEEAPTDLALTLDYRIHHLLIDEFQDTSEAQMRLFEALTRGWMPSDGRSLFLVGDPMQSIYRFRKAEVSLFLQVRSHGLASGIRPEPLALFRNNRSCPTVIAWVNRVFPALFGQEDILRGEVAYRDCVATRTDSPGAGVFVHPLLAEGEINADTAAARVTELIRAERDAHPQDSIAVLVRARAHLEPLLAALRHAAPDIAYRAVEIDPLASRQPIADLVSLTRALLHRADRVHWLACLRAPWCGLTLADMLAVAGDQAADSTAWQQIQTALTSETLSADGQQRLAHFAAALGWALSEDGRLPLRERVEGVWQRLQGPRCLPSAADRDDCMRYLDLLESLQDRPDFSVTSLNASLARLYAAPQGDDRAVQLMTIHKSKGLEFNSVILFGLERGVRSDSDTPPLRWDDVIAAEGERRTLVSCLPFPAFDPATREIAERRHRWIRDQEGERKAAEHKRLLYVAATRARDRLHLVGSANLGEDDKPKTPSRSSLLALLWPALYTDFITSSPQPAASPGPLASRPIPPLIRLRQVPEAKLQGAEDTSMTTAPGVLAAASLDAAIGTLVHRALELIARQGLAHWNRTRVHNLMPRYADWLTQRGFAAPDAQTGAARAVTALCGCLDSEAGRWVLQAHTEAVCEYEMLTDDDTYRIDRAFVSEGVRWIVDYKTVALLTHPQVEAERHRDQLQRYGALFARLEPDRPQQLAILFVGQGVMVCLTS